MNIPNYFKSVKQYESYIKCLDRVEIGNFVDVLCLRKNNSFIFIRNPATELRYEWQFGDSIDYCNIITLPIIGVTTYKCGPFLVSSVGVSSTDENYQVYPNKAYMLNYNIPVKYKDYYMYCNSNLDMIYLKIHKGGLK